MPEVDPASAPTKLARACINGDATEAQVILTSFPHLLDEEHGFTCMTPLLHAVEQGHLGLVQWLAKRGARIDKTGRGQHTPLSVAALNGHLPIVQWLANKGVNKECPDVSTRTPLMLAACHGHIEVVQWMAANGCNVKARDSKGNTALNLAACEGELEMVQWLVSSGWLDIDSTNDVGTTAMMDAAHARHDDLVQWLMSAGANVLATNKHNETALSLAKNAGLHETAALLTKAAEHQREMLTMLRNVGTSPDSFLNPANGFISQPVANRVLLWCTNGQHSMDGVIQLYDAAQADDKKKATATAATPAKKPTGKPTDYSRGGKSKSAPRARAPGTSPAPCRCAAGAYMPLGYSQSESLLADEDVPLASAAGCAIM